MNIKSLSLKNTLIDENTGEGYLDLTAPSFIYDADLGVRALHYVMPDQAGRVDKISEIYFGTSEYIDAICIVNNIFNSTIQYYIYYNYNIMLFLISILYK